LTAHFCKSNAGANIRDHNISSLRPRFVKLPCLTSLREWLTIPFETLTNSQFFSVLVQKAAPSDLRQVEIGSSQTDLRARFHHRLLCIAQTVNPREMLTEADRNMQSQLQRRPKA
jgi:hypothetical protein